jgi:hypothetical protein
MYLTNSLFVNWLGPMSDHRHDSGGLTLTAVPRTSYQDSSRFSQPNVDLAKRIDQIGRWAKCCFSVFSFSNLVLFKANWNYCLLKKLLYNIPFFVTFLLLLLLLLLLVVVVFLLLLLLLSTYSLIVWFTYKSNLPRSQNSVDLLNWNEW